MKKNLGTIDRTIRILIAAIIVTLYFTHAISGVTAIVLLAVSAIFILTGFLSFCPIYYPFGISTRGKTD